jgi:hypothetical protein
MQRLRRVCAHLTEDDFERLVAVIVERQLRYETAR